MSPFILYSCKKSIPKGLERSTKSENIQQFREIHRQRVYLVVLRDSFYESLSTMIERFIWREYTQEY